MLTRTCLPMSLKRLYPDYTVRITPRCTSSDNRPPPVFVSMLCVFQINKKFSAIHYLSLHPFPFACPASGHRTGNLRPGTFYTTTDPLHAPSCRVVTVLTDLDIATRLYHFAEVCRHSVRIVASCWYRCVPAVVAVEVIDIYISL